MVCSLSSSETVHYANRRDTQEAWTEFDIASISDVLCKWSSYACSFEIHTSRDESFSDQKRCSHLCVGCARLFRCVKDRQEKMDMIQWIIAPNRAAAPTPDDKALMKLCKKRVVQTRSRAHEHYRELPDNFVTTQQLSDRTRYDNDNCYLVGSPMSLESNRFDSLSFYYVFPISTAKVKDDCWSIQNMQPMAHCLNYVKANETDKGVK